MLPLAVTGASGAEADKRARAALDKAASPQEWNTYLLASPEFNYR